MIGWRRWSPPSEIIHVQHYTRRMVTIVTEAALERALVAELESLGVRGFTITDARGKGSRGLRQSDWAQEGNIRVEVICDPAVADSIAATGARQVLRSLRDDPVHAGRERAAIRQVLSPPNE